MLAERQIIDINDLPETQLLESAGYQPMGTFINQALSQDPEIRALEEQLIAAREAKANAAIGDAAAARKAELQAQIDQIGRAPYVPVSARGGSNG